MDAPTPCSVAAYHALAELNRPNAVHCLRRLVSTIQFEAEKQDALFESIDQPGFVSELQNWLSAENDPGTRARLLVALANCGCVLGPSIVDTFQQSQDRSSTEHNAMLLRLLGRTQEPSTVEILERWASCGGEVDGEAAVFSLGRVRRRDSHHTIRRYLGDERRLVAAAAIEALAKYVGPTSWDDIAGSQYDRCPDTNTAFHRAVVYCSKPSDLAAIALVEFHRPDPRVRLSAARCFATIAHHDQVRDWLSSPDIDATTKTAFDEVLFARPPFVPAWFSYIDKFDPSVAALDVRLTNLDPERVHQAVHSDQVRTINAFMAKPADGTARHR